MPVPMLEYDDFNLEVLQATGFTRDQEFSPARVLRALQREWGDLYDGDLVSLPVPESFPVEAPYVTLQSADGRQRVEVARRRINLFRVSVGEETIDRAKELEALAERLVRVSETEEMPIGRLAAVAHNFADVDTPSKEVARHFFQERWLVAPFNRPEKLEIHSHKVFDLTSELRVNSWVRVRTAQRLETLAPVVFVEQDINTLAEERAQRDFGRAEVLGFFRRVADEHSHILRLYFPPALAHEES
jgi:hypothetical protein